MERTERSIELLKDKIDAQLERGICERSIGSVAQLISDIKTVECYLHEYSDDPIWRMLKYVSDELSAAEKYITEWKETGDSAIKAISADELKHAQSIIGLLKQKQMDDEQTECLQKLVAQHQQVAARLA